MNVKIFTDDIEQKALEQVETLCRQPAFADCKVRIMPDVHAGAGCVIGFTADLGKKVIPNVVGVDIGCGMLTASLGKIDIDFNELDRVIRQFIPCGMNVHEDARFDISDLGLICDLKLMKKDWLNKSLGTLGGGNHFIEIDADEDDNKYLVIHSGSRNLGKQVCEIYQERAMQFCSQYKRDDAIKNAILALKAAGRESEIEETIRNIKADVRFASVPKELCYLEGQDREDYLHDMKACQFFAFLNRGVMSRIIIESMGWKNAETFETVHNYIGNDNIVRKGAIAAYKGQRVLIPMNMRDGCIIGIGKGNEDWNNSAPHGAGRIMSRKQAKSTISLNEYKSSMEGVYSTCIDESTLDESPMAYKPIDEILRYIEPTVEIERIITPIYNFKAQDERRTE